ncbi:hypothetical protein GPALN_002154 [Globodera pallida]|nr:hypothetical protein GPALN_002154 [Globodera pallida]
MGKLGKNFGPAENKGYKSPAKSPSHHISTGTHLFATRSCALPAIGPARALPAIGPARVHRPPAPFSDVPLGRARSSALVQQSSSASLHPKELNLSEGDKVVHRDPGRTIPSESEKPVFSPTTLQKTSTTHHTVDSDDEVEADEDEEEAPEPEEEDSGEDEFTDELRSSEFNSRTCCCLLEEQKKRVDGEKRWPVGQYASRRMTLYQIATLFRCNDPQEATSTNSNLEVRGKAVTVVSPFSPRHYNIHLYICDANGYLGRSYLPPSVLICQQIIHWHNPSFPAKAHQSPSPAQAITKLKLKLSSHQVVETVEDLKNQNGDESESDHEDFETPGNRNATVVTTPQDNNEVLNVLTTVDPFASQLPACRDENLTAFDNWAQKFRDLLEYADSPQRKEMTKRALMTCRQRESETVREFMARLSPLVSTVCAGITEMLMTATGAVDQNVFIVPQYPHQISEVHQDAEIAETMAYAFKHAAALTCDLMEESHRWAETALLIDPTTLAHSRKITLQLNGEILEIDQVTAKISKVTGHQIVFILFQWMGKNKGRIGERNIWRLVHHLENLPIILIKVNGVEIRALVDSASETSVAAERILNLSILDCVRSELHQKEQKQRAKTR